MFVFKVDFGIFMYILLADYEKLENNMWFVIKFSLNGTQIGVFDDVMPRSRLSIRKYYRRHAVEPTGSPFKLCQSVLRNKHH